MPHCPHQITIPTKPGDAIILCIRQYNVTVNLGSNGGFETTEAFADDLPDPFSGGKINNNDK